MRTREEKRAPAIEIFKRELAGAKGKFSVGLPSISGNVVEFFCDGIFYCTINVQTGLIRGI